MGVIPLGYPAPSPGIRAATFPPWHDAKHYTRLPTPEHEMRMAYWCGAFTHFAPKWVAAGSTISTQNQVRVIYKREKVPVKG